MGFYGNVTYYLSNAFQNLVYQNANLYGATPSPSNPATEYTTTPRSRNDRSILAQGNKWIVFGSNAEAVGNNTINIYHKTLRDDVEPVTLPVEITSSNENLLTPSFGAVLTIPTITFDNAGHITAGAVANVQLPTPAGEDDLNNIKNRIATLEEYLTGTHGDDGSGEGSSLDPVEDVNTENTYGTRIGTLEKITEEWERKKGAGYESDPLERYREEYGIGTTLHDLMVLIGLREESTITVNSLQKKVYTPKLSGYSNDSLLGKTDTAISLARAQSANISTNRQSIRDIITYLNDLFEANLLLPVPINN